MGEQISNFIFYSTYNKELKNTLLSFFLSNRIRISYTSLRKIGTWSDEAENVDLYREFYQVLHPKFQTQYLGWVICRFPQDVKHAVLKAIYSQIRPYVYQNDRLIRACLYSLVRSKHDSSVFHDLFYESHAKLFLKSSRSMSLSATQFLPLESDIRELCESLQGDHFSQRFTMKLMRSLAHKSFVDTSLRLLDKSNPRVSAERRELAWKTFLENLVDIEHKTFQNLIYFAVRNQLLPSLTHCSSLLYKLDRATVDNGVRAQALHDWIQELITYSTSFSFDGFKRIESCSQHLSSTFLKRRI